MQILLSVFLIKQFEFYILQELRTKNRWLVVPLM